MKGPGRVHCPVLCPNNNAKLRHAPPSLHVVTLCATAGNRLSRVFYCATTAPPAPYFPLYVSTFLYPLQRGAHRLCDNALQRHIFCVQYRLRR